ncbi:hypothetical protein ACPTJ8_29455, partial [Pseudomonas aeruginosa]|uniref:hypothetical protein n=1 Tax=Pseudomonas aeruginosa TaxID=287 RepID=UPI003CC631B7
ARGLQASRRARRVAECKACRGFSCKVQISIRRLVFQLIDLYEFYFPEKLVRLLLDRDTPDFRRQRI